ncbi:MAG: nucleotide exchange factor GrpE [Clostridia bacterium]|nr:nucleotide exchange factor GrpE [Clostridia bacterium]
MSKIIGIDLGYSNARVAVIEGRECMVLSERPGVRSLPSALAFDREGSAVYGEAALNRLELEPRRVATGIRSRLGPDARDVFGGLNLSATQAAAVILLRLKAVAEDYLGESVSEAVLTVPNRFTQSQRKAMQQAARLAGLEPVRLINDSDAALLAFGMKHPEARHALICDLGGGSFEAGMGSVFEGIHEMLTIRGDARLGGWAFDDALAKAIARRFARDYGYDLLADEVASARLCRAAERARIALSEARAVNLQIPCVCVIGGVPRHLDLTVTREEFEALTGELIRGIVDLTGRVLADGGACLKDGTPNALLLTGGGMRTPAVRRALAEAAGGVQVFDLGDDAVVQGAAVMGGILNGDLQDPLLLPVTAMAVGVETQGGVFTPIIPRDHVLPGKEKQLFSTSADNQVSLDVHVLQGDGERAADAESLFRFSHKLAPAPKGVPRFEITLEIDANGIVTASGRDLPPEGSAEAETKPAEPAEAETPPKPEAPPGPAAGDGAKRAAPTKRPEDVRAETLREVIGAILPTIDNLELAIASTERVPGGDAYAQGMRLTLRGLLESLEKLGLEELPALGKPFDPNLHSAMARTQGGPPGLVVEVYKKGYRLNGRIIRFAEVRVST